MLRLLPIAVPLCFGLSCQSVQSTDLIGTWTMKESSRQILPAELRANSATIVMEANGTFVASDLPGIFDFPPVNFRLYRGNGVWKLVSRKGKQQVQLDFHVIPSGSVTTKLPFTTEMDVSKGWSVSLYYILGDPDEGRRVEFERK